MLHGPNSAGQDLDYKDWDYTGDEKGLNGVPTALKVTCQARSKFGNCGVKPVISENYWNIHEENRHPCEEVPCSNVYSFYMGTTGTSSSASSTVVLVNSPKHSVHSNRATPSQETLPPVQCLSSSSGNTAKSVRHDCPSACLLPSNQLDFINALDLATPQVQNANQQLPRPPDPVNIKLSSGSCPDLADLNIESNCPSTLLHSSNTLDTGSKNTSFAGTKPAVFNC